MSGNREVAVSHWPIRRKLLFGFCLLLVLVGTLAFSGFRGVYAYRSLVRTLSARSEELPAASRLGTMVGDLRMSIGELHGYRQAGETSAASRAVLIGFEQRVAGELKSAHNALVSYQRQVEAETDRSQVSDRTRERQTVAQLAVLFQDLASLTSRADWTADEANVNRVALKIDELRQQVEVLPSFLHEEIQSLHHEVRTQYRTWIVLEWVTSIAGAVLLLILVKLSYDWVLQPLQKIIHGSRRVAAGDYDFRIQLSSHDEMRELAEAMNAMTAGFQQIREDLDGQVAERTKQVIRSEQLASVGFLAAGVAHEINNPLASIALCAESLEGRVDEALSSKGASRDADKQIIRDYLRMIQSEAFRCKDITGRLLDFSRRDDQERHPVELRQLVTGVADMVRHLGQYQDTNINLLPGDAVVAPASEPQLKQVVLNLLTNGLESLSPGGTVHVEVRQIAGHAEIVFTDNGCGMSDEVREHLFEPFFTRRQAGKGIGLGLSITYRIVADHGGDIEVHSEGPGRGSRFCVRLPLAQGATRAGSSQLPSTIEDKEPRHRNQAA
jgi:signal transduction histidine kinase